jgi:hypothetical protein
MYARERLRHRVVRIMTLGQAVKPATKHYYPKIDLFL